MRHMTRRSKFTLIASATIFGLGAPSLAVAPAQTVTPSRISDRADDSRHSGIVPIRVTARISDDELVPTLAAASTHDESMTSRNAVLALTVQGAPLSFDGLTRKRQDDLRSRYGKDAGQRYETGFALRLKNIVDRIHADHPTCRVGVTGMPFSPTTRQDSSFNTNYAALIESVDVFLPRASDVRSDAAMQTLSTTAGGRQIVPITGNSLNSRSGRNRADARDARQVEVRADRDSRGSRASGQRAESRSASGRRSISLAGGAGSRDLGTTNDSDEISLSERLENLDQEEAMAAVIAAWGSWDSIWDLNGDGIVDGADLTLVLGFYSEGDDNDDNANDGGGNGDIDGDDGGDNGDNGDNGGDDGSVDGIQNLISGSGFNGSTPQPGNTGSSASPGYGAEAIARWTELPYITRDQDFYVTVSAYHMTDIDRVEFMLNGGDRVVCSEVRPHPDTGYAEYIVNVDVSGLAVGLHEIRAIIYPNHGKPRVLQGRTPEGVSVHQINNGTESFWFNYDPNPTTVHVGPNGQYDSISDAINALGEQLYGGRIYLSEGTHHLFDDYNTSFRNTEEDKVLTISAAPGLSTSHVFITGYAGNGDGYLRNGSIHVRNVSALSPTLASGHHSLIKGGGANRLFIEGVMNTSLDPVMGWGDLSVQRLANAIGDWEKGCWVLGCDFINVPKGIKGIMLAKNCTFTRMSADAFGSGPGAAINCWLDMGDPANANHQQHADIFQLSVLNSVPVIENRIFADITSTNSSFQIGHITGNNALKDLAFVRWTVDSMYGSSTMNFFRDMDHVVVDQCVFRNSSISWNSRITHALVRDTLMRKFASGDSDFDDIFVPSKTIIDNVHFTGQSNPPFAGSTVGPVHFAAPSPPLGVPSNGTDGYIPTHVMTDVEFETQYIGNADCEKRGQINDHFYYDKSLLDLRWWR